MSDKQHSRDITKVDDRGLLRGAVLTPDLAMGLQAREMRNIRNALLHWVQAYGRHFPWRTISSPWSIVVTEILLRKTTADAVARFLAKFLDRYPTPHALAAITRDELASQLAGLGLRYQRADQLLALAKVLVERHNGQIPEAFDELLSLPGVGIYTAVATRVFGFGRSGGVVDTNTVRIISRLYEVRSRKVEARKDKYFWDVASHLVGEAAADKLNWSLLDLGALLCTPRDPRCSECPIQKWCGTGQRVMAEVAQASLIYH